VIAAMQADGYAIDIDRAPEYEKKAIYVYPYWRSRGVFQGSTSTTYGAWTRLPSRPDLLV
jgi:hypothetical protein